MSIFVVCDLHINAIVSYAENKKCLGSWTCEEWGGKLAEENLQSYNARYPQDKTGKESLYQGFERVEIDNPVWILKMLDCIKHQCCVSPNWDTSCSKELVDRVREIAIRNLSGYKQAPWEYTGESPLYYSRSVEKPKNEREGLMNFIQLIVNDLEACRDREALYKAVDLLDDLSTGVYPNVAKEKEEKRKEPQNHIARKWKILKRKNKAN